MCSSIRFGSPKCSRRPGRDPDYSFFGGPIEPWFEYDPPKWLLDTWQAISGAFAFRDLGAEPFEFDLKRLPYGANYAVRTRVQREFPLQPQTGPSRDGRNPRRRGRRHAQTARGRSSRLVGSHVQGQALHPRQIG